MRSRLWNFADKSGELFCVCCHSIRVVLYSPDITGPKHQTSTELYNTFKATNTCHILLLCHFLWIILPTISHSTERMGATSLPSVVVHLAFGVAFATATCPHEDGSFDNWSDPTTWNNGKVN